MLHAIRQFAADWIKSDQRSDCHDDNVKRTRALLVTTLTGLIYVAYGLVSGLFYDANELAFISSITSLLAISAFLACRYSKNGATAGHIFTLSLAVQVFGEMTFNGGLQAPSAPLTLLIVLSAIFTAGPQAITAWASVTVLGLMAISTLDLMLLLPLNEFPRNAQIGDRVVSLGAGIAVSSLLIAQYESQARMAMKKLQEERAAFEHRALHDSLTDMPNRSHFYEYAKAAIESARQTNTGQVIFYFDIDGFKQVNDQLGHAAGDQLLNAFSKRLQSWNSETHFAARLAGDEFAMICTAAAITSLEQTSESLRAITANPLELDDMSVSIGLSIGHARFPQDGQHLDELLSIADTRMYTDKALRREEAIKSSTEKIINIPVKTFAGKSKASRFAS